MSGDLQVDDVTSAATDSLPAPAPAPSRWSRLKGRMKRFSRRFYISSLAGLLLLGLLLVFAFVPRGSTTLHVFCQSNLRSAQLSILVDGDLLYQGTVSGTKKRPGIFVRSGTPNFSHSFSVKPGKHTVVVHVSAPSEAYDQAKIAYVELAEEKETILGITTGPHAALVVNFEGGATLQTATASPAPVSSPHLFSVLISVLGTMLSASISFLVQEFWRSHRRTNP